MIMQSNIQSEEECISSKLLMVLNKEKLAGILKNIIGF